jgi:hypothetical protein
MYSCIKYLEPFAPFTFLIYFKSAGVYTGIDLGDQRQALKRADPQWNESSCRRLGSHMLWGDGDSDAGRSRRRMQQTLSSDKE